MEKRPKRKYDFLSLGILTFLAVTTWIIFEVYRVVSKKPEESQVTEFQTRQLSPTLDTSVLDKLQKRVTVNLVMESPAEPAPTASPSSQPQQ